MVAKRRVELEYVFDRLGEVQLSQAYGLLVPERQRLIQKGADDDNSSNLRKGIVSPPEGKSDDCQPDSGSEGVRRVVGFRGSSGVGV